MRRFPAIVIALLVFYSSAGPVLACVAPQRALTAQERECCQHMAEMCGPARMPRSHSCCTVKSGAVTTMVVTRVRPFGPVLPIITAALTTDWLDFSRAATALALHHTPPETLSDSSVLRI